MKPRQHIQLKRFGASSLLLEWPARIDRAIAREVLAVHDFLLTKKEWGILESVPAYHSLLIEFDPELISNSALEEKLLASIPQLPEKSGDGKVWTIPVNYNGEDILTICKLKGLRREQLIQWHSEPEYFVYFIGFLPGFLYLGELAKELHVPRRSQPRARVPKGSVAIGGEQTGIYPQDSPGGWHLIGHTNFSWFSLSGEPPCQIAPGDRVKFIPQ